MPKNKIQNLLLGPSAKNSFTKRAQCGLAVGSSDAPPKNTKRRSRTGAGHRKKTHAKAWNKWKRNIQASRKDDLKFRHAHSAAGACNGSSGASAGPKISIQAPRMLDGAPDVSQDLMDNFYHLHPGDNDWLEVSERANVSNPEGVSNRGKGVFAKQDIPSGTRLCPYVGYHRKKPCPSEEGCQYDLRMAAGFYVCARKWTHDIGYLQVCATSESARDHSFIKESLPCPPNYGRYFNTASGKLSCNCRFEIAEDGHDVMYIYSSCAVRAGEELLVDYGDLFTIASADSVSDAGTDCSDDEEFLNL